MRLGALLSFWIPERKLSDSPKIKTHKLYVLIAEGLITSGGSLGISFESSFSISSNRVG